MLGVASKSGNPGAADPVESASGRVAAVVACFPPSDLTTFGTPERLSEFPALNFDAKRYPDYSPIRFASSDDPPTLIVHGDRDSEVPIEQGRSMHEALTAAGASTEFIVIEGAGHGFRASNADRAAAEMVSWFERHLRGR